MGPLREVARDRALGQAIKKIGGLTRMMMREEGEGWVKYRLLAFRPRQAAVMAEEPEASTELVMRRAVARFLADNPQYRRGDVTEVLIDVEPLRAGLVTYAAQVSYTRVEMEQV